jgi:phosphopantetheine adenylyltransferase
LMAVARAWAVMGERIFMGDLKGVNTNDCTVVRRAPRVVRRVRPQGIRAIVRGWRRVTDMSSSTGRRRMR